MNKMMAMLSVSRRRPPVADHAGVPTRHRPGEDETVLIPNSSEVERRHSATLICSMMCS